nr:efflux RND transporter permease subunit [Deinobacterium chartae]
MIRFFVDRFVLTFAIFGALILFGLITIPRVGVDLMPKFDVPVVAVTTVYPGAGPEEIANQVSKPIEDQLTTLVGIDTISSSSGEGFSQVVVQFQLGKSVDQVAVEVSQRVAGIRGSLPRDAEEPVVSKFDPTAQPILSVALEAPGRDLTEVARYAEDTLKPKLQRVDGVTDVQVTGGPEREIQVLLNPARMQTFGLSPAAVSNAIASASFTQSAGSISSNGQRTLFSLRNEARRPEEIAAILVDAQRGLRVSDVATVRDTSATPTSYSRLNGQPVVTLSVRKSSDSNAVSVADELRALLKETKFPAGYSARIVSDTTEVIKATVEDTFIETLLTVAVVSVIVLIFLGKLNTVFSTVLAIPISVIGAIIVFGLFGFTFNIVSLLAIIVAVGIVVDDSIVVAENIERYRSMGYGLRESVLKGGSEVISAVSASTLSLLAVFLPISFLPGIIGQFFQQFGIVLAAAVFVSWIEALFFLTVRMAYFPDPVTPTWREVGRMFGSGQAFRVAFKVWFRNPFSLLLLAVLAIGTAVSLARIQPLYALGALVLVAVYPLLLGAVLYVFRIVFGAFGALSTSVHSASEIGFERAQNVYARSLGAALRRPGLVLAAGGLVFASIVVVGPMLPFNFVPKTDDGLIQISLDLPKGTSLSETDAITRRVENYLLADEQVETIETAVGTSSNVLAGNANAERADLTVTLKPKHERAPVWTVAEGYREAFAEIFANRPELEYRVTVPDGGPGGAADFQLILNAPTPEMLAEHNARLVEALRATGYFSDVRSSLSETNTEQVFMPDNAQLSGSGLTAQDIAATLRAYNAGGQAAVLRQSGQEYPIIVRGDPRFVATESDLLSLPVYSNALRQSVPLGSLGHFQPQQTPATLARTNQIYSAGINANFRPGAPGLLQVQTEVNRLLTEKGIINDQVTLGSSGDAELVGDLATAAPLAFLLALLLNYLVIASQFNSFRYPMYILLTVPLALVGAFWAAALMGTGLDIISMLGTVLLIGLVTKNAILLLDFVVRGTRNLDLRASLVEAGRLRLRPITMTTMTVLVISLPLLLGIGQGGELRKPLGVIILGGVLSGTLLTLYVVPAAFYLFERRRYERGQTLVKSDSGPVGVPAD